jgi:hypothetical protein
MTEKVITLLMYFSCVDKELNDTKRRETHECRIDIQVDVRYIYSVKEAVRSKIAEPNEDTVQIAYITQVAPPFILNTKCLSCSNLHS